MSLSMDALTSKKLPPKKKTKTALNLNGRKLTIESTSKAFNNEIINGAMKALKVQLIIDDSPKVLEAGYESDGEMLKISLEGGTHSDLKKLKRFWINWANYLNPGARLEHPLICRWDVRWCDDSTRFANYWITIHPIPVSICRNDPGIVLLGSL